MSNAIHTHRQLILLLALLVAAVVAGCGMDSAPLASDEGAVPQPATKRIKSNGNEATVENTVGVTYDADGRTVTGVFGPEGGTMKLQDRNGTGSKKDDIEVALTVPAGEFNNPREITMTVYGVDLQTLVVAFRPSGLVFNKSSDMRIDLGNDLAPNSQVNKIVPVHLYEDGSTEDVDIYHVDRSSNALNIYLKVPGFSRYRIARY